MKFLRKFLSIFKRKRGSVGRETIRSFVTELNNNAYLREHFKDISMTVQFNITNPVEYFYVNHIDEGFCEFHDGHHPSPDYSLDITATNIHHKLTQAHPSTIKPQGMLYHRKIDLSSQSEEEIKTIFRWMNRLKEYRKIKIAEKKFREENTIPFHSRYHQEKSDHPFIHFLLNNGEKISLNELRHHIGDIYFDNQYFREDDFNSKSYRYDNIYCFIQEGLIYVFALDKTVFDLAMTVNVDPLTIFVEDYMREIHKSPMPSISTLEYYGFEPAGGWDESKTDSSKEYWAEKFIYSFFFNHWQDHSFREMNPGHKGFKYPEISHIV